MQVLYRSIYIPPFICTWWIVVHVWAFISEYNIRCCFFLSMCHLALLNECMQDWPICMLVCKSSHIEVACRRYIKGCLFFPSLSTCLPIIYWCMYVCRMCKSQTPLSLQVFQIGCLNQLQWRWVYRIYLIFVSTSALCTLLSACVDRFKFFFSSTNYSSPINFCHLSCFNATILWFIRFCYSWCIEFELELYISLFVE